MTRVAIIGGGLAGTSLAFSCIRYGLYPIVCERETALAGGASGNFTGLVNPRFAAEMNAQSYYFSSAFQAMTALLEEITRQIGADVGWRRCGALHLINDDKKSVRFQKMVQSWGWPEGRMSVVSKRDASQLAGVDLGYAALYLPQSGYVSPPALCEFYARGAEIRLGIDVTEEMIGDLDADVVVLANAHGAQGFSLAAGIPFGAVRGQITKATATDHSRHLRCNLHYGGYCTPEAGGTHIIGATFQRWLDHSEIIAQDDADNLAGLGAAMPGGFTAGMTVLDHRAAVRCTSRDHFPVVGKLGRMAGKDVYISAAHGSHGIVSTRLAAEIVAGQIAERDVGVPQETLDALSPARFL